MMIGDNRKLGIGLTGIGSLFLLLGVLLLFDKALLALGNVSGCCAIIGYAKYDPIFLPERKDTGHDLFFLGGIGLVLIGWPISGMFIELFGIVNLFGNFFPIIVAFLRRMPVIGTFLNIPGVSHAVDTAMGQMLPTHTA